MHNTEETLPSIFSTNYSEKKLQENIEEMFPRH